MFNLHDFVMSTLRGMHSVYPQWQVQQIALGYYARGWIADADLAELSGWYAEAGRPEETPAADEAEEE